MAAQVALQVTAGPLAGRTFTFDAPAMFIVGRAADCGLVIPVAPDRRIVSRYHCLLDIAPPKVCLRDLGSNNGTLVNGRMVGRRQKGPRPDHGPACPSPVVELRDGDDVQVGDTLLRVTIRAPRVCPGVSPAFATPEVPENYHVVRKLGEGAFGAVCLARHVHSGRPVALKTMLPHVAATPDAADRFLREIELTKALVHPNVVRLFEAGSVGGSFFLAMEYCEGGSLERHIRLRGGALDVDEALGIIFQVLDGLDYAHQVELSGIRLHDGRTVAGRGLVHRDIKPSNILLDGARGNPTAKVGDYGLAKAFDVAGLSGHTAGGALGGTPAFVPRQQVLKFKYARPEVDVWAAAATLYNMLTGCTPRDFDGRADPWATVLETDPVPTLHRGKPIPRPLAQVIDAALRDDPHLRFTTAGELKRALAAAHP